ncbi:cilia- and flagella-associated protein 65 isoform X1 [Alexandromys fortis]|uniref:cilia- and flagella-associated protein 65 isoform X1 n=1 Tax=Alexandromys fortis TaxID=100897 RepID=UPI0021538BF6|nr:cilia- and flagella-associated protein 65 isoform X1 [Microtus fortis]XP_049985576.1 cilia- and flagella-associated protein 65 isoform X1 [Microtus fortis]XP_049985577.1 cilia- and flagella-associated protein 65 isoform X1 [Microtus fortis]XP_049985578.1 cilia- and flagella-associated protein 65 isoform X1 [Microtus fortis]XP_049985579.1 cilia- and flagella-associated protein 65 isoform X1 [Microtus fortis]
MLIRANSGHTMRPRDSGDYTVNDGSFLSASTLASSGVTSQLTSPPDRKICTTKKQSDVKKRVVWGIEVAKELQWKGWELGKETTRNLVLKNLSLKIQKIKYRPPKTKFFFTIIPQPIFLSPGITLALPIIFRPLEEKEYTDQLWLEKEEGVFCVSLKATLPCHKLVCPTSLQLPICAIGDTVETWFCLNNVGDLPTFFTWEVPNPFQILPSTGFLEPGLGCRIKVTFEPLIAAIHEVEALCWYGKGTKQKSSIQIQAAAKCAQLLVSIKHKQSEDQDAEGFQKVLHFGSVSVGCTMERQIRLYNPSMVNAPFKIEMSEDMLTKDHAFSCSVGQGIVPPGEKKCLSVFFHPKTSGSRAIDYFSIVSSGCASQTVLQVIGLCKGPDVCLQHYCVNFSWVQLGEHSEQTLWIENQSDCLAHFQFDIDCQESVFSIRPTFGSLAGKTRMTLHCAYQPTHPIICFRRVACLIHHQDPLFLDLIGTCHSDNTKPAILKPQHLTWYRTHLARGLTLYPPDILAAMLKEKRLEQDENGALMLPTASLPVQDLEDLPAPKYPQIPPMMEYFFDGTRDLAIFPPAVSLEPFDVDFGACPGPKTPNPIPLCLRNHTKGKITVVWTRRSDCPFWVTPETSDVPPLKSIALRLHFQPASPNCLYAVELEAFALYKVLQSYSNIEEDCTVAPSWCLKVRARGHSYYAALEHHIPQYSLDAPKMFPAVSSGEPSYRSLLLVNEGPMLLTFSQAPNSSSDITLRPSSGLVAPGAHQVFLISTYPKGTSWKQHIFYLQFNFYPQYLKEVSMQSREEPLQLKLDTHKCIFFKPTWVGCSSTSDFTFHNPSRLPLEFEWRVSQQHQKMLAVQPSKGIIHPNESLTLTWIFSPLEETKYLFRVGMWVWEARQSQKTHSRATTHYWIRLVGMGVTGCLSAKPKELDFGNVLVNSREVKSLVLLNDGNCTLYYRLVLEQQGPKDFNNDPCAALELNRLEGTMPPHSQDTIYLTACPKNRSQYSWTISYCLLSHRDSVAGKTQKLCHVSLVAVYPLLSILDICSMGSAEGITRKHLWHLFSLDTLNSYLSRDPTLTELTYKVPTRHSLSPTPPVFTPLKLDFNFGAAPLDAPPSVVLLVLKNSGLVSLDWAFLFPSDQQLDLDVWVEQAELSCTELHQMRAEDNCLFSINPKAGTLSPGQEQMVEFKYSHLFIGTDRLSVLFKVSHGREILLHFIGVTVRLEQKYVHFTSTSHQFIPVPIGDTLPPRQIYELYNGGSVPVTYEVQVSVLSQAQEKNFDHPIFCCLNPRGEIQPGTTARILWIFSPIEAKTYTVDVPIHILGWNSAVICFQGVGYDPYIMGDTAPFHNISSWDNSSIYSRLMVPGQQNVFLSQSHISLGNIPVQAKCSRLLFLNNISKSETVVFTWQPRSLDFGEVTVSPMEGEVGPEEATPILVTLKASVHASFYSMDLICKVYRQELMHQYHKDLQEWNEEKARQEVEFTITDMKAKRRAPCTACEPVKKYKTLPPITNQPSLSRPASWNLKLAKEETSWPCPQPPVPGLLCLGLTARAHAIDYYLANFFSEFSCHFLYRELPKKKLCREESKGFEEEPPDKEEPVWRQKKQLLVDCLTAIIRGLLEDKTFQEAVDQSLVEQVPYFCQFWNEQSARFLAHKSSLYLMPILSLPSGCYENGKGKEEGEDKCSSGKDAEEEEDEDEEEEEEEGEAEEEEEERDEKELSKEEMEEEIDKGEKLTWSEIKATSQPTVSQQSLQWQWQQDLKTMVKEEQENDEKEAIGRLPAFLNLQEAILENMIQNILVEASRGEVVLTSRPRIIALPPVSLHRPDILLPMQQEVLCSEMQQPTTDCLLGSASSPSYVPA